MVVGPEARTEFSTADWSDYIVQAWVFSLVQSVLAFDLVSDLAFESGGWSGALYGGWYGTRGYGSGYWSRALHCV